MRRLRNIGTMSGGFKKGRGARQRGWPPLVHDLLEDGKIDEANALYRDKSMPLIVAIKADSYTLISRFEDKIDKAALHARIAK